MEFSQTQFSHTIYNFSYCVDFYDMLNKELKKGGTEEKHKKYLRGRSFL